MSFAVPNEREEAMTGVSINVPNGVRIVRAFPVGGWDATADESTATWRGGALEHLALETFRLDLEASAPPGQLTVETVQLYGSQATVTWPATVLVVPGPEQEDTRSLTWVAVLVAIGVVTALGVALASRRRQG
jgi:hypothetical protein